MYVKPKEGLKIFDPFHKDRLPAEGREVSSEDMYWQGLLRDGDVILADPPAETVQSTPEGGDK